ncbi:antibiotic biosynthesis protein [Sphaerisporangium krabiense]|uniref:SAM-dependent methyltransferase n=1 Tax=Sphaerisporangium krabiense TaxID=763782 RepID=A0A7W9DQB4_9ACTN|nr:methyltransferase domain-containing protein [Sphaerisporangium krabiense]MBB5626215.1 SAM-dependent methyltransferase [Sphaerisporangium krabiense]GII66118.1 antibiotic biosynthesis protein [Sphaerisporangium krabiense]
MTSEMIGAFALEAELYDELPFRRNQPDVEFYRGLAGPSGGPVLDLACGTGRVTLPCAREAGEAVGVDLAPEMLERARAKAVEQGLDGAVAFVEGDMCTVRLDRTFPLIVMAGQPLFFLSTDDQLRAALDTVRAHLAPGGRWAAGVPVLTHAAMLDMQDKMRFVCEVRHPRTGQRVVIWDYTSVTEVTQVATRRRITEILDEDGLVLERRHSVQTLYYRHPAELQRFIREAGFRLERVHGAYDGRPFGPNSGHLVWVATAGDR